MFNKIGLSRLLLYLNLIILFLSLTSSGIFFVSNHRSIQQLNDNTQVGLNKFASKSSLLKSVAALQSNILATVNEKDKDSRDIRFEIIDGLFVEADKNFEVCGSVCFDMQKTFSEYKKIWKEIVSDKLAKNDLSGASSAAVEKLTPLSESLIDNLDKELIATKKNTEESFAASVSDNRKAQILLGLVNIVFNIVILVLGLLFRQSIVKSFKVLTSRLNSSAVNTLEMSNHLFSTSSSISHSTDNQNQAVQSVVSSLDEINAMASQNFDTANSALDFSNKTNGVVTNGQHAVHDMIAIMEEINSVNQNMESFVSNNNTQLEQIVNLINSINEKTKVVNDIVFQTKLLSFNASVEAARAGEHGKGFAVVAEEVGSLAQMSGNASKEISELVASSLSQVKEIVEKSKANITDIVSLNSQKIGEGGEKARYCGDILTEIETNVSSLNELIKTVVVATDEQKSGINEIGQSMRKVESETQQNKVATVDLNNNSNELKDSATTLKELTHDIIATVMGERYYSNQKLDLENRTSTQIESVDTRKIA